MRLDSDDRFKLLVAVITSGQAGSPLEAVTMAEEVEAAYCSRQDFFKAWSDAINMNEEWDRTKKKREAKKAQQAKESREPTAMEASKFERWDTQFLMLPGDMEDKALRHVEVFDPDDEEDDNGKEVPFSEAKVEDLDGYNSGVRAYCDRTGEPKEKAVEVLTAAMLKAREERAKAEEEAANKKTKKPAPAKGITRLSRR